MVTLKRETNYWKSNENNSDMCKFDELKNINQMSDNHCNDITDEVK